MDSKSSTVVPERWAAESERQIEDGFDNWLVAGLHRTYGGVVSEPLPSEIVDLMTQLGQKFD